jgi:ATP-binding cassette subfamily F protein 3
VVDFRRGRLRIYPGNISDYLEARSREQTTVEIPQAVPPPPRATDKERKRQEAEERQRRYARTKPLQDKIAVVEREIEKLVHEKSLLEQEMADPAFFKDGERAKAASARYKELEAKLPDRYFRWGTLNEELERLRDGSPGEAR